MERVEEANCWCFCFGSQRLGMLPCASQEASERASKQTSQPSQQPASSQHGGSKLAAVGLTVGLADGLTEWLEWIGQGSGLGHTRWGRDMISPNEG
jgi:hypothetical protein